MAECLFCRIVDRQIPSEIVHEDEKVLAFKDINPQAPVHLLLIPKEHVASIADMKEEHQGLLGGLLLAARNLAEKYGLSEGYRLVNNCGPRGGQTVYHIHFHLLGGRDLNWPPG